MLFELLIGPWLMIKGMSDGSELGQPMAVKMSHQPG
jgi:hypothetical protein